MMNFFGGNNCGGSCDILIWLILLSVLNNCGGGCERRDCCERRCEPKGCGFNIDICTLILLFVIFGGGLGFGCK